MARYILVFLIAGATLMAQDSGFSPERLQRITQMIERHMEAGTIVGAVTMVARNGRVAHFEARGLMDKESGKPMTKDAIFRIASMTKPIAGVAIMMLVEEGKVRLNDPVSRFIPEFKNLKVAVVQTSQGPAPATPRFYTVPADREVIVRDLLTHTSGLVSGAISTAEAQKVARKPGETLAAYIPRLGQVPLEFQPGSRWTYSPGAGFDTLGRIVEVASGSTFDQFLKQRVFQPLGMMDTFFSPAETHAARLAPIYQRTPNGLQRQAPNTTATAYFSGGGGLSSTAEDYLQFGQMLVGGGQWNGKRLLSPRSIELMGSAFIPDTLQGRPRGEGFGLSVRVVTDAARRGVLLSDGSYGWSGAFGTHFWVDPKENVVGILMIQTGGTDVGRDFESAVMQALVE